MPRETSRGPSDPRPAPPLTPWEGTTDFISDTINHRDQLSVKAGQVHFLYDSDKYTVLESDPTSTASTARTASTTRRWGLPNCVKYHGINYMAWWD